jgi:hypothetical protein
MKIKTRYWNIRLSDNEIDRIVNSLHMRVANDSDLQDDLKTEFILLVSKILSEQHHDKIKRGALKYED